MTRLARGWVWVCCAALVIDSARGEIPSRPTDYSTLYEWLSGTFSSRQQSLDDPSYFDIRLHMAPIWRERSDGLWLYVEQARADALDQPYRQRVYCLVQHADGAFESRVYDLPGDDPLRFAGAGKDGSKLAGVRKEDLKLKEGCSIWLKRRTDGVFEGATRGKGCASTRQGAAYTTSEVTVTSEQMVSWDRGWDKDGNQVWGATKGGYVFRRVKE
jgi:hypothetical protein